ncbi:type II secretion system F family protein [Candidatus Parvarchaeota archaeon]|nr:type II secretion system F family protein [Candidatus Parvarchaeota archaeon]
MAQTNSFLESLGRLFSRKMILDVGKALDAAGLGVSAEIFAGGMIIACIAGSLVATFALIQSLSVRLFLVSVGKLFGSWFSNSQPAMLVLALVVISIITTACIVLLTYVWLSILADNRKRAVDMVLPDFLTLSAANIRAGMSIDQAMWYAAKPEFGMLSKEVELVAKRTFGGEPFNTSIDRLSARFNSRMLRRTVALVKQGLASGGQIADIFEQIAQDARNVQLIQSEISASLLMYIIFVVFAASVGAPFLFAVSNNLIAILEKVFANLPPVSQLPAIGFVRPRPPIISSGDFFGFTVIVAITTAIFSSLMIGVIQKGSKLEGIKYLPVFIVLTLVIYAFVSSVLATFLGSLV